MNCYICKHLVGKKWIDKGVHLICTNQKCKALQDDCEAYTAKKYKQIKNKIGEVEK